MKPTVLVLAGALLAPALASAQAAAPSATPAAPAPQASQGSKDLYAVFVTSKGKIGVRLLPAVAPNAVQNFVALARGKKAWADPETGAKQESPLYDGTLFHRVIPGFMIQGGDPLTRGAAIGESRSKAGRPFGTGNPGYKFADEIDPKAQPFLQACQLAMANSGPNTNGSQFFITEVPTPHLDPKPCNAPSGTCGYVHLGEGVCGCDLVAAIARAGNSQTRLEKVVITSEKPTCK
jgi:peptidylprolyl isomerase/peptidyl-prolyl cis-trans isomerase A (cyclophilin A)